MSRTRGPHASSSFVRSPDRTGMYPEMELENRANGDVLAPAAPGLSSVTTPGRAHATAPAIEPSAVLLLQCVRGRTAGEVLSKGLFGHDKLGDRAQGRAGESESSTRMRAQAQLGTVDARRARIKC